VITAKDVETNVYPFQIYYHQMELDPESSSLCQVFRFELFSLLANFDLLIANMADDDVADGYVYWTWVSENEGLEDALTFAVCLPNRTATPPVSIEIRISCLLTLQTFRIYILNEGYFGGNFAFRFHIDNDTSLVPKSRIADTNPSQGEFDLSGIAVVRCSDGNTVDNFTCYGWADCVPFYPVWPATVCSISLTDN
jgi:hypothetical protein